jgi:hypothetical protein
MRGSVSGARLGSRSVAIARFLPVLLFFLLPTLRRFVGAVLKLTFGGLSGFFGMLRELMSGLAGFERGGAFVAFLAFALGLALSFAGMRTGGQCKGEK